MLDFKENSITLLQGVLTPGSLAKIKYKGGARIVISEGRPSLRAAEHNSRYFLDKKVTPIIICDNMAGFLFFKGFVKQVYLACQYADKGGALCDTGALICAVLAKRHKIPVKLLPGKIRTRFLGNPKDILSFEGSPMAPKGTYSYAPLVEWVPGKYLR